MTDTKRSVYDKLGAWLETWNGGLFLLWKWPSITCAVAAAIFGSAALYLMHAYPAASSFGFRLLQFYLILSAIVYGAFAFALAFANAFTSIRRRYF